MQIDVMVVLINAMQSLTQPTFFFALLSNKYTFKNKIVSSKIALFWEYYPFFFS